MIPVHTVVRKIFVDEKLLVRKIEIPRSSTSSIVIMQEVNLMWYMQRLQSMVVHDETDWGTKLALVLKEVNVH